MKWPFAFLAAVGWPSVRARDNKGRHSCMDSRGNQREVGSIEWFFMQNEGKYISLSLGLYKILASQEEIHYLSRTSVPFLCLASLQQPCENWGLNKRADFANHGPDTADPL